MRVHGGMDGCDTHRLRIASVLDGLGLGGGIKLASLGFSSSIWMSLFPSSSDTGLRPRVLHICFFPIFSHVILLGGAEIDTLALSCT